MNPPSADVAAATGRLAPEHTLGLALISRASMNADLAQKVWDTLAGRVNGGPDENGALHDMALLLIATGQRDKGLELLNAAVTLQPLYVRPTADTPKLRLLAFMRPGDFMANTPLDFLLEDGEVELIHYYLDGPPQPSLVPDHDLAFMAVGEAPEARDFLASMAPYLEAWPRPVLNARPDLVLDLSRDGVTRRLAGRDGLISPAVARTGRRELAQIAAGALAPEAIEPGLAYPILVRPLGSHAGHGLEKVDGPEGLARYLQDQGGDDFYVTRFVDYAGEDGLYRKYRIVLVQGRPFIAHMAVSPRWMVHYLNADMAESPANRQAEAEAMATFDEGFATRHADAIRRLHEAIPLDYFGIDCAETADGRLLIFEADVAIIVHAMDPPDLYPYKPAAMSKLFRAFREMLDTTAAGASPND